MTDSGPRESRVKKWSAGGPFTTIMVTTTSHPQRGGGGGRLIEMTCEARFTSASAAARTPAACLEASFKKSGAGHPKALRVRRTRSNQIGSRRNGGQVNGACRATSHTSAATSVHQSGNAACQPGPKASFCILRIALCTFPVRAKTQSSDGKSFTNSLARPNRFSSPCLVQFAHRLKK